MTVLRDLHTVIGVVTIEVVVEEVMEVEVVAMVVEEGAEAEEVAVIAGAEEEVAVMVTVLLPPQVMVAHGVRKSEHRALIS